MPRPTRRKADDLSRSYLDKPPVASPRIHEIRVACGAERYKYALPRAGGPHVRVFGSAGVLRRNDPCAPPGTGDDFIDSCQWAAPIGSTVIEGLRASPDTESRFQDGGLSIGCDDCRIGRRKLPGELAHGLPGEGDSKRNG